MSKKKMHLNSGVCLVLLTALFIFFSTSNFTTARFTDSANIDGGLKLTLGNLDLGLAGGNSSQVEATSVTLKSGVALPEQTLKNEGTLDGKLAYKITVEGYNGNIPPEVSFAIGNETFTGNVDSEGSQFLVGSGGGPICLDSGETITITPKIKSDSLYSDTEKITVILSFFLIQSNATEAAEKMFYDEAEVKTVITMKSSDPNTSPAVWPTEGWQTNTNGKVKVNISDLINTHYYGDSAVNAGSLTFLDNPTIYLEFSNKSGDRNIKMKELEIAGFGTTIVYDENYADNGRVKIIYNLNEKKDSNLYLIKVVNLKLNFAGGSVPLYSGKVKAKKLILNTDKPDGLFNTQYQGEFPIYASNKSRSFFLSYIKDDYSNDLNQSAKPDIAFSDYQMSTVTSEKYLNAEIDRANNAFSIYANEWHNQTEDAGTVEILITGNSNEPLILKRAVKTLRTEKTMIIPEQWALLSGGVSIHASKLQLNLKTILKDGIEYLVSDESNPPALYFKNAGSNFFGFQLQGNAAETNGIKVKDVVYSSDLSVMKVTFTLSAPEVKSYDGFNIDITNGLHTIVNGSYVQYSKAIQSYPLNIGNVTAAEWMTRSETTESPEAEGMVAAATEVGETAEILAEPETTQKSQNQTDVPPAASDQPAETPIEILVK